MGVSFEVIVVNDASTDLTAAVALEAGARVVEVHLRKISAVRNVGARHAKGDAFFFIDADTRITDPVLRAALNALHQGAAGGGAWVKFAEPVSWPVRLALNVFGVVYMCLFRWAAGCFIFARRAAFEAVGGFDESLYASEEIFLSIGLKRQGRFVLLREGVITSGRKLRLHSPWRLIPFILRFLCRGPAILRQRAGLDWWYDGKREKHE